MSDNYNEIAKKLEEYRKKKHSQRIKCEEEDKELKEKLLAEETDSNALSSSEETEIDDNFQPLSILDYVYYVLCFTFWAILYAIFIKLQFGTIFFLISCLVGICINTRTRPKKKGEISAYSVFNKDFKSIDGTLKAEQFEREIRYGSGAVQ
ncbi:uncharacterized protein LOC130446355 [Diorhabda sublineata]|uniref:uncharacterized protein LOC130446355 n=1 Tax=Diorhabda sublineata TaxID=1163346 RepID=UPI0024E16894|nr:uncharacterized protein LOC130446355 [Diorhabda sublineata]